MERVQLTTISGQDISSAALVATYTASSDSEVFIQLYLEGLAGGGIYQVYTTKQLGGAGTQYKSSTTPCCLTAGITTLYVGAVSIPMREDDVLRIYAGGLAGDIAVDGYVEIFSNDNLSIADAVWDELIAGHLAAGTTGYTLNQILVKQLSTLAALQQYSCLTKYIKSGQVEIRRSTDVSVTLYNLGDLTGRTSLYFTVKYMKEKNSADDSASVVQIEESAGLLYINKELATAPANGSITVVDAVAGTVTIELTATESDKILPNEQYLFDIKKDNDIVAEGRLLVSTAITRTVT